MGLILVYVFGKDIPQSFQKQTFHYLEGTVGRFLELLVFWIQQAMLQFHS